MGQNNSSFIKYMRSTQKIKSDTVINTIGINYEAGKIIDHIKKFKNCIAYANCQIATNAPFYSNCVNMDDLEITHKNETSFVEYYDISLIEQLKKLFNYIKLNFHNVNLVIQIARGKSAKSMIHDIINPILQNVGIVHFNIVTGYKTHEYYVPTNKSPFIFVNIGTFAVLFHNTGIENIKIGKVYNVTQSYNLISYDKSKHVFTVDKKLKSYTEKKNILNQIPEFDKLKLFGLSDNMQFVSPHTYTFTSINLLLKH